MTESPRIHQASCSLVSGPEGTASFDEANRLISKVAAYARRLGVAVTHDNVDRAEDAMGLSRVLADLDDEKEQDNE